MQKTKTDNLDFSNTIWIYNLDIPGIKFKKIHRTERMTEAFSSYLQFPYFKRAIKKINNFFYVFQMFVVRWKNWSQTDNQFGQRLLAYGNGGS